MNENQHRDKDGALLNWFIGHRNNLVPFTIIVLLIFLFVAICLRIEGLGILSITGGILFLFFLMYGRSKEDPLKLDSKNYEDILKKNATDLLNELRKPQNLSLAVEFIKPFLSHLENNIGQMSEEQIQSIKMKINILNKKLSDSAPRNHPEPPRRRN